MPDTVLRLRKGAERRLRGGHLWVYSNEVDTTATPLKGLLPGTSVVVEDARGKPVGAATVNPASLICARIYSADAQQELDRELLVERLRIALHAREELYGARCYRWVYGDGDLLSGLVVDRFDAWLSVQLTSAGMDARRDMVLAALLEVLPVQGIVMHNQGAFRQVEQLPEAVDVAWGEVPELVPLTENGVRFVAPLLTGQKTGWFYDHRENRALLQRMVAGKSVLDVFSYIGGWGVAAAAAGAATVECIDASADAVALVAENAALNGVGHRVTTRAGRAADVMKALIQERRRYEVIVLDPPAFIQRRKDQAQGEKAYHQINELAVRLLAPGGILVSASCSLHLPTVRLMDIVRGAAQRRGRQLQIIAQGGQAPDHPVHPAIAETSYLKALFARDMALTSPIVSD